MSREPVHAEIKFFGGRVCLDFANTLNWRLTDHPVELIADYSGFLDWSEGRGTLSGPTINVLRRHGAAQEASARSVMEDARALRANLIKGAEALRSGHDLDLKFVNHALAGLPPQPKLVRDGSRFVYGLDGSDVRQPLWPIIWSLTAMLASSDAGRVAWCQADGCGWFFIDESPNHSRLWCSDGCGNRERVRRSYAKRRAQLG